MENRKEKKENLQYIQYQEHESGYKGYGVSVSEDNDYLHVTNIIGSLFLANREDLSLGDLLTYKLYKKDCEWSFWEQNPLSVEDWIISYPVDGLSAYQIHHTGLFFEWFLHEEGTMDEKLEKAIASSVLNHQELNPIIRHILHQNKGLSSASPLVLNVLQS